MSFPGDEPAFRDGGRTNSPGRNRRATVFSSAKGALVTDTTAGWHFIASGLPYPAGNPPTNQGCDEPDNGLVIPLTAGFQVNPGDSLTVTLIGVTNPSSGTVADFTVATSADTVAVAAAPYTIGASASGILVYCKTRHDRAGATDTISALPATASLTAGTSTVTLQTPPGRVPQQPGLLYGAGLDHAVRFGSSPPR